MPAAPGSFPNAPGSSNETASLLKRDRSRFRAGLFHTERRLRHHIVEARSFHAMRVDQIGRGLDEVRASCRASGGQGERLGFPICSHEDTLHLMDLTVQFRHVVWTGESSLESMTRLQNGQTFPAFNS
jgi:hypothetical protein